jgi:hypothetical protein
VLARRRAAEATTLIATGFLRTPGPRRIRRGSGVRLVFAGTAAACLLVGAAGGCADRSANTGEDRVRPGDPAANSIRDARSSSDQLYDTYGRIARERGGH